jgi:hypothetical protein
LAGHLGRRRLLRDKLQKTVHTEDDENEREQISRVKSRGSNDSPQSERFWNRFPFPLRHVGRPPAGSRRIGGRTAPPPRIKNPGKLANSIFFVVM